MSEIEVWQDIPGARDYQISNFGRVRNVYTYNILGGGLHNGRVRVNLYIRSRHVAFYVHRLVAEAFLPDYSRKRWVMHKDLDTTNNHHTNLYMGGNFATRLPHNLMVEVVETGERYSSAGKAARAIGGQQTNVSRVLRGTLNQHKGHTFRYVAV